MVKKENTIEKARLAPSTWIALLCMLGAAVGFLWRNSNEVMVNHFELKADVIGVKIKIESLEKRIEHFEKEHAK